VWTNQTNPVILTPDAGFPMSLDYVSQDDHGAGGSLYSSYGSLPENPLIPDLDPPAAAQPTPYPSAAAQELAAAVPDDALDFSMLDGSAAPTRSAAAPASASLKRIAAAPGPVVAEEVEASDDNDTATTQTVDMMARYIREASRDPYLRYLASGACHLFARDRTDPYSAAWSVFWFLKHRIRRVLDEGIMLRIGRPNEHDLLTDPRVLLRSKDAQEDCDGFTMAALALLTSIGVPACMVTVACDRKEPGRWSHVFTMVRLPDGNWFPIDCSHGPQPGWMVPRRDITRWQAWDINGKPIEAKPASRSTLHGYMFRPRGMGDTCTVDENGDETCTTDTSTPVDTGTPTPITLPCLAGAGPLQPGQYYCPASPSTSGASPTGTTAAAGSNNWLAPLFNMLGTTAKVIQNETLPVGTVIRNADGSITANLGPAGAAAGLNINSLLPGGISSGAIMIGVGLLALVLIGSAMGKK